MAKSNEYLYGEGVKVPEIPADVIVRRIELLKENLEELLEHSYYTRDGQRINDILAAIKFWETINER